MLELPLGTTLTDSKKQNKIILFVTNEINHVLAILILRAEQSKYIGHLVPMTFLHAAQSR